MKVCINCIYFKEYFDKTGPIRIKTGLAQCTHEKYTRTNYVSGDPCYDFCHGININGQCVEFEEKV